jgi:RNA polymerase sigma factor (sigma-70 family)
MKLVKLPMAQLCMSAKYESLLLPCPNPLSGSFDHNYLTALRNLFYKLYLDRGLRCHQYSVYISYPEFINILKYMSKDHSRPEHGSLDNQEKMRSLTDHEILNCIYHTYATYIYMIVQTKMSSTGLSEEDTGDCFCHIIMKLAENNCKKVRQFRGGSTFKTYLTVICGNMIIDYIRSEIRKKKLITNIEDTENLQGFSAEVIGVDSFTNDPALQLIKNEQAALVAEAVEIISKEIGRLGHQEQCIFRLRIDEGRSYREIDEFLDIDNSKYLFLKILSKIRTSIDSPVRKKIEELLLET